MRFLILSKVISQFYYINSKIKQLGQINPLVMLFVINTKIKCIQIFFFPEIENYLNEKIKQEILSEKSQEFDIKRDIGENFNIISEFIRNDSVEDFISYVNYNNYSLINNINKSIFETNEFLIDKTPSLIEYAVFFGSIQIFRYLIFNKVEMTPSLWLYTIHSRNPEIIHLLE